MGWEQNPKRKKRNAEKLASVGIIQKQYGKRQNCISSVLLRGSSEKGQKENNAGRLSAASNLERLLTCCSPISQFCNYHPLPQTARHLGLMNYTFHFHLLTPRLQRQRGGRAGCMLAPSPRCTRVFQSTGACPGLLLVLTFNSQPKVLFIEQISASYQWDFPKGNHTGAPFLPLNIFIQVKSGENEY